MKLITTSAQKTIQLSQKGALEKLVKEISAVEDITFIKTKNPNIYQTKYKDNSTLTIASFKKDNGDTLAMIDHKNVPENHRQKWHSHWREALDDLFTSQEKKTK